MLNEGDLRRKMKIEAELVRLRRLYHHVANGGKIRPQDIGLSIEFLEELNRPKSHPLPKLAEEEKILADKILREENE